MKRVWAISLFFFGVGLFTGIFIDSEWTKVIMSAVGWILSYCLFFK